jgi:type IV pilus assembly protein PilM
MADRVVLGLDIGTSRIKFVEARMGRGGPIITNAGMGMTPRDTIANGVIVDPHTLGASVRQLLTEHGVRTKSAISSVASQSSLVVRPIEVPRMTREELASTMTWEVDRHIPFAASEVVMDFEPLIPPEDLSEETQNMEVLLAVAQEDMIEAHVQTLYNAGLDPVALDVEPLSACRSLIDINRDRGAYDRTYALLNIGANTTDLSIFRPGGLLSFTRAMPLAGDNITNAIAEALGYEFHEAERAKLEQARVYIEGAPALGAPQTPEPEPEPDIQPAPPSEEPAEGDEERIFDLGAEAGPAQPPPPQEPEGPRLPAVHAPSAGSPERQVYDAILPTLGEIVSEVRRSVEYYTNRFPDSRIDAILVYGGTAALASFPEFLANEVGINVEVGNPFQYVDVDEGNVPAEMHQENGCFMPIVVGLAVREMIG